MGFSFDITTLKQNISKALNEVDASAKKAMGRTAQVFANAAAKFTPPTNKTSGQIPKEKYDRPIISLIALVRGKIRGQRATEKDREMLKQGMRFKVLYKKGKHPSSENAVYGKTPASLKRAARIATRGLAKVMWGKNISKIEGANTPALIKSLLKKSPALNPLPYNEASLSQVDGVTTATITNKSTDIERFAQGIASRAQSIAEKELKSRIRAESRKKKEI